MTERELLRIFGANIRRQRAFLGLSQAGLAEKVNISINFLSDIETGKKWASPVTMVKFADVFRIEAYELLKPPNLLPDDAKSLIGSYTEDIKEAIESVRKIYFGGTAATPVKM
jgi:transcriptional regulator with XRE-family HTH domain